MDTAVMPGAQWPDAPLLRFFADLEVFVDRALEIGETRHGRRRMIAIVGGHVRGDGWTGRVLPGGADFQLIVNDRVAELDARYALQTDDGERIFVVNHAIRVADAQTMAKLARGEPVDPATVYFRCVPRFETDSPQLQWITERVFVGLGARHPDRVSMRFFEML